MMLVLVLSTVFSFSSCSKDENNGVDEDAPNSVIINGKTYTIIDCKLEEKNGIHEVEFHFNYKKEHSTIEFKFSQIPSGDVKATKVKLILRDDNIHYIGDDTNVNCKATLSIDKLKCSVHLNNLKLVVIEEKGTKQQDVTVDVNYNGRIDSIDYD